MWPPRSYLDVSAKTVEFQRAMNEIAFAVAANHWQDIPLLLAHLREAAEKLAEASFVFHLDVERMWKAENKLGAQEAARSD